MRVLSALGIGVGSLFCVIAASLVIVLSVFMNGYFAFTIMGGQVEELTAGSYAVAPLVAAVALACVDVLKCFAPLLGRWSIANKNRAHVLVCAVIMIGGMALSFFAAYGFIMELRSGLSTERAAKKESKTDLDIQLKASRKRIAAFGFVRPAATIAAELEAQRQHARWGKDFTAGCTDATATKSREFCKTYNNVKAELGTANAVEVERKRMALIEAKLEAIRSAGGAKQVSPQLDSIAELTGYEASSIETISVGFIALMLEFASTFGLFFALGHGPKSRPQAASSATTPLETTAATGRDMSPEPRQVASDIKIAKPANTKQIEHSEVEETIDLVARYGSDRLEKKIGSEVPLRELHTDYKHWCQGNGITAASLAEFTTCLKQIIERARDIDIAKKGGRSVLLNMQMQQRLAVA